MSCRLRCGHQVIPYPDAGSREYRLRSSRPPMQLPGLAAFDAVTGHPAPRCGIQKYPLFTPRETVRATGEHGPCILNLPFLFPQKKRESQKKAPGRCPKAEKWLRGPGGKNSPGSSRIRYSIGYTAPGSSTASPRLKHLFPSFGPLRYFSFRFLP